MMYFLDFDRTLFDTESFLVSLKDEPACAPFAQELRTVIAQGTGQELRGNPDRERVWTHIAEAVHTGSLVFTPGQLSSFVYADVTEQLVALGNEAIVLTAGDAVFQRAKVESALANIVRVTAVYVGVQTKAEYLANWPGYYGQEAVLVDDMPTELLALSNAFPNLKLFEMRRDGGAGDGRFPVIHSLSELP